MAIFEAFCWNFSLSTNPEIGRSVTKAALLFISKYDDAKKGNRDRFFTLYLLASFITCVFPMTKQRDENII